MDRRLIAVEAALAKGLSARIRVHGASMTPAVRDGQRVVIRPLGDVPLQVGDVVACAVQGQLRVHRVVEVRGEQVLTAGDANPQGDPPLERAQVLGRVAAPSRQRPRRSPLGRLRYWLSRT